jgi:hypothetical protein
VEVLCGGTATARTDASPAGAQALRAALEQARLRWQV